MAYTVNGEAWFEDGMTRETPPPEHSPAFDEYWKRVWNDKHPLWGNPAGEAIIREASRELFYRAWWLGTCHEYL